MNGDPPVGRFGYIFSFFLSFFYSFFRGGFCFFVFEKKEGGVVDSQICGVKGSRVGFG